MSANLNESQEGSETGAGARRAPSYAGYFRIRVGGIVRFSALPDNMACVSKFWSRVCEELVQVNSVRTHVIGSRDFHTQSSCEAFAAGGGLSSLALSPAGLSSLALFFSVTSPMTSL